MARQIRHGNRHKSTLAVRVAHGIGCFPAVELASPANAEGSSLRAAVAAYLFRCEAAAGRAGDGLAHSSRETLCRNGAEAITATSQQGSAVKDEQSDGPPSIRHGSSAAVTSNGGLDDRYVPHSNRSSGQQQLVPRAVVLLPEGRPRERAGALEAT
jgi:hypothetical protein